MSRYSEDIGHVNNNGLLLLDFCKQIGVRTLNGGWEKIKAKENLRLLAVGAAA